MNLVKRMRSDPKVDIVNYWKLVTIFMGVNDFCSHICYFDDQEQLINDAERSIINSLRIIRDNLPRTLVNLMLPYSINYLEFFILTL